MLFGAIVLCCRLTSLVACSYGVYVLIVEILGAVSTVLYGVNLLWDPINEEPQPDPNDPALPLVCPLSRQAQGSCS